MVAQGEILDPGTFSLFKVVYAGTLPDSEIFSHSEFWAANITESSETVSAYVQQHITNYLDTTDGGTPIGSHHPTTVVWTSGTVYTWDRDTNAQDAGTEPAFVGFTAHGTSVAAGVPNQCALAATKRRATRGRTAFNRFYLPPMEATLVTGSVVNTAFCTAVASWMASEQSQMRDSAVGGLTQCVYSPKEKACYQPLSTYVGTRLDTVRRRVSAISEGPRQIISIPVEP